MTKESQPFETARHEAPGDPQDHGSAPPPPSPWYLLPVALIVALNISFEAGARERLAVVPPLERSMEFDWVTPPWITSRPGRDAPPAEALSPESPGGGARAPAPIVVDETQMEIDGYLREAADLLDANDHAGAARKYLAILELEPGHHDARQGLDLCLRALGVTEEEFRTSEEERGETTE